MKEIFASSTYGIAGLVLFFTFFIGILIWVMRPGSKDTYNKDAQIPLKDEDNDR